MSLALCGYCFFVGRAQSARRRAEQLAAPMAKNWYNVATTMEGLAEAHKRCECHKGVEERFTPFRTYVLKERRKREDL